MIIGNYTADVSVGETAPSPISPEPWCLKDTIRGGRVLDGGDACQARYRGVAVASRPRQFPGGSPPRIIKRARVFCEREGG